MTRRMATIAKIRFPPPPPLPPPSPRSLVVTCGAVVRYTRVCGHSAMHLLRSRPRGGRARPKWTCVHLVHFILLDLKNLPRTGTGPVPELNMTELNFLRPLGPRMSHRYRSRYRCRYRSVPVCIMLRDSSVGRSVLQYTPLITFLHRSFSSRKSPARSLKPFFSFATPPLFFYIQITHLRNLLSAVVPCRACHCEKAQR